MAKIKKDHWLRFITGFLPAAVVTATILFFSVQPAASQAVRSFPLPAKPGHFLGYFILTASTYWGLQGKKIFGVPWAPAALGSFLWALLVAFLDEFNQGMALGRRSSIYDVFIDAAGAGAALLLLFWLSQRGQRTGGSLGNKGED